MSSNIFPTFLMGFQRYRVLLLFYCVLAATYSIACAPSYARHVSKVSKNRTVKKVKPSSECFGFLVFFYHIFFVHNNFKDHFSSSLYIYLFCCCLQLFILFSSKSRKSHQPCRENCLFNCLYLKQNKVTINAAIRN